MLGHATTLAYGPFPEADPALLVAETAEYPIQVNGKVRGKITVAADDREHQVYVSQDGEDVISQEEEGSLDSDDREKLSRVQVPLEEGLATALETVNGTVDEAQLETEDGTVVWEVEIDEPDGNSVDVFVNVEDGSVLKIDR